MSSLVEVNEGDMPTLTVSFYNESDVLTAPASATWSIIDVDTGTEMMASTAISGIASSVALTVPAAATAIVNDAKKYETRRVIVEATFAASRKKFGVYNFQVKNLVEG